MAQFLSNLNIQTVEPSETFVDPVSKIRISQPENLIDTDFEYGLQGTKWETLELSNNVPSYYVSDSDLPISNVSTVEAQVGSSIITVRTAEPHGLVAGTPIDVRGLTSRTGEGKYLIKSVPTNLTFTYTAVASQTITGNLGSVYTTITPGQFYSGSQIPFDPSYGITSDGAALSKLTIHTPTTHGFPIKSNFYLVNSIGTKKLVIPTGTATTATAPDGRPYVDIAETVPKVVTPDLSKTETKATRSTYYKKFDATGVDIANNKILWTNHRLRNNDTLLYVPPSGDNAIGGMQRFQMYYVRNAGVDDFQLSYSYNGTPIDFTSAGTYTYGRAGLHLAYEIYHHYKYYYDYRNRMYSNFHMTGSGSGWDLSTYGAYGLGGKQPTYKMLFSFTGWGPTSNAMNYFYTQARTGEMRGNEPTNTPGIYNFIEDFERYKNYSQFRGSDWINYNGPYWDYYDYNGYYYSEYSYYPYNGNLFFMYIDPDEEADTFYAAGSNLTTGAAITLATTGAAIQVHNGNTDLYNGNAYVSYSSGSNHTVERVSADRFRIRFTGNASLTRIVQATGTYTMSTNVSNPYKHTLFLPNHGFATGDTIRVTAEDAGALPATNTNTLVPNTSIIGGNLDSAFGVINAYFNSYMTTNTWTKPLILDGSGAGTSRFANVGVSSGSSLLTRIDNYPDPYIQSRYYYGQAVNVQNGFLNNAQLPSAVKDAGEGTVMAGRNFSYVGTEYKQNVEVPHYTTVYGQADLTNRDVVDMRLHTRLYTASGTMSTWATTNNSYTLNGDSGWRASFGARWGTSGTAAGYVEYHGVIWNNNWVPGYSHPLYEVYVPGNDGSMYCRPYSENSSYWGKPIFFRSFFLLDPAATYDSTTAQNLGNGLMTYFANNFKGPQFVQGEYVEAIAVDNNRVGFRNSTTDTKFIFSGQGTSPIAAYQEGLVGTNDGTYTVTGIPSSNQMTVDLPFQSPTSVLNINIATVANNLVTTAREHFFAPGTQIVYRIGAGSSGINELTAGNTYYLSIRDENTVGFAETYLKAINGELIAITAGTGNDSLEFNVVNGRVAGVGTVTTTSGSNIVVGSNGSLFKRYFKVGDKIGIKDNNSTPGKIQTYQIAAIADDQTLQLTQVASVTATNTKYFLETKLYARPDGYAVHRPFDGGVEIAAGTAPYSQIARQTRKYFRYQSGKGIQTSLAINFNPPVQFETLQQSTRQTVIKGTGTFTVKTNAQVTTFNTVSNGNLTAYTINNADDPTLTLYRGVTYTFNVNAPGQNLVFQTTNGTGYDAGNVYTTGVTGSGTDVGQITFTPGVGTPATLYYQSQNTIVMNGTINVIDDPGIPLAYVVNGDDVPTINVVRGEVYTFDVDTVGHNFQLSTASLWDQFNDYSTGVINDGDAQGTISWTVPLNAPSTLYYVSEDNAVAGGTILVTNPTYTTTVIARGTTRYPHRLSVGSSVKVSGSTDTAYNGDFLVTKVVDDATFEYDLTSSPSASVPAGFIQYNMNGYTGSAIRAGMFDFQNGFFYEFDGTTVYAVRRSSTQQLSGKISVFNNSSTVRGVDTNFYGQLSIGDMVVIRGGSYKVVEITSRTDMVVQPQYKGVSADNVIITKTVDTKVPQLEWSIDKCLGDGLTGFNLDLDKIQMAYMDYSWYGAGKIRFGFKDTNGHVKYVHEFIHNNRMDEAYMRSGNLPARYEITNGANPTYAPTLFHWGTSVIMDGRFDNDNSYLFTGASKALSFTNGQGLSATTNANSVIEARYNQQRRSYDWYTRLQFASTDATKFSVGSKLYTADLQLNGREVAYTQYSGSNIFVYIFLQTSYSQPAIYPSVNSAVAVNIGTAAGSTTTAVNLGTEKVPLLTIRLAPSVDSNLTGALGAREIINRMQLKLNEVGLILTHDCEVSLILNGDLSSVSWEKVKAPSLSNLIKHESGDKVVGGTELFSFRASGGSTDSTGKRLSATSNFPLEAVIDMGNSILGGDGIFPNGPDILTVAVKVVDTQGISATSPFVASSRITWAESQA